jgi:outer membrane protein TolC
MNRWRAAVVLALGLGFASGARAQPAGVEPVPVTVKQALQYALRTQLDIQTEDRQIARAQAQVGEARAGYFAPSVDLVSFTQRNQSYDTFAGARVEGTFAGQPVNVDVVRTLPKYDTGIGLEASLNLYSGGASRARLKEAQANEAGARAQAGVTRDQIVQEVTRTYWQLRKAQADHARRKAALELAEDEAGVAEVQFKRAQISEFERDTRRLRVDEMQARVAEAEYQRGLSWQEYRTALGAPAGLDLDVVLLDDPDTVELASLLGDSDRSQPALQRAQAQNEAAQWRQERARSEFQPSVSLYMRYNGIGRDETRLVDSVGDLHRQDWSVGLRLRWNLFNGSQSSERVKQAQQDNAIAALQVEKVRRQLSDELQEKKRKVELLDNKLALARKRLDLSESQLRISARRRDLDQITNLQFKAEQLALAEARDNVLFAKVDAFVARLTLKLAER